jgi:CDP-diglyceride synthetase
MKPHPPRDWLEFFVRFVCGAFFGGIIGLGVLLDDYSPIHHAWMVSTTCGIVFGILAGIFGDRFWEMLKYW